jgi:hypothetical protein
MYSQCFSNLIQAVSCNNSFLPHSHVMYLTLTHHKSVEDEMKKARDRHSCQ